MATPRSAWLLLPLAAWACEPSASTASSSASTAGASGATAAVSLASSGAPSAADATPPPPSARLGEELAERARALATKCAWSDDSGFGEDCSPAEAFASEAEPKGPGTAAGDAAVHLLRDADPRVRRMGLALWSKVAERARDEAKVALVELALGDETPALDLRLAYAAAVMPGKGDALRPAFERLVRTGPVAARVTVLLFMHAAEDDPPWLLALAEEALRDAEPAVRAAAVHGLGGRAGFAHEATCSTWVGALNDRAGEVRQRARLCIVGSIDIWHDDAKRGLIAGRASPHAKPCAEPDMKAAFDSADADRAKKLLGDEADAELWAAALRRKLPEARATEAQRALEALASDRRRSQRARVIATRALAQHRDDHRELLATLARDPDPEVAKAAAAHE